MTIDATFGRWLMLLGGALAVGVVSLAVGIIHERRERRRSR
jgi:hypothetical protein